MNFSYSWNWYCGNTESKKSLKYGFAAGTAVGILMGITAGILIAPKSGKETRHDIVEEVESTIKKVAAPVKGKLCCHKKAEKVEQDKDTEDTKTDN